MGGCCNCCHRLTIEEEEAIVKTLQVPIIWILGGPGSGKTIMAKRLCARYRFAYLALGDLISNEVLKNSKIGKEILKEMKSGKLVSREILFGLIQHYIAKNSGSSQGFIFDGYPREIEQMRDLEAKVAAPCLIFYFVCSDETMKARMYAVQGAPDANSTILETRKYIHRLLTKISNFHEFAEPVLKTYRDQRKIVKIDAEQEKLEVYLDCRVHVDSLLKKLGRRINPVFEEDTDYFV